MLSHDNFFFLINRQLAVVCVVSMAALVGAGMGMTVNSYMI